MMLDDYISLQHDDIVVICYTPEAREAAAYVSAALIPRGIIARLTWMHALRDPGFEDRLTELLPVTLGLSRLVVLTFELDTMSHTDLMRRVVKRYPAHRCMVVRAIGAGPDLFAQALKVAPQSLTARNAAILNRTMEASCLHIETRSGSSLDVILDNDRYRWISNRGAWRPGTFVVIPAGEVATFPLSIGGVLVGDFAFHINTITDLDVRLDQAPVSIFIEDSNAVDISCDDRVVRDYLWKQLAVANGTRVGELGFGTNFGVTQSVMQNSHVNERVPGVHIGFGQHNQGAVGGYFCPVHLDVIAFGGLIWVDDDPEPIDLQALELRGEAHPSRYFEEDVLAPNSKDIFDDCCGTLDCMPVQGT